MKAKFTYILAGLMLCLLIAGTGWGQGPTATINGQVTDASGAAVPNAAVTAKDLDRGTTWPTQANGEGYYSLPRLPIGRYDVEVQSNGFQLSVQRGVELVLDQVAKIDFQLKVGAVTQTLEVTSAAPLLQTEATEISTVMQAHAIASLPLETRNYNQLALLMPGAITTSPAAFNTGQATFNSGRPYINGNREQATYYLLDGMENTEFVDNNVAYSPNVDAIEEFNVVTNNPSAQYGQFLGGVISVSLKSGSNEYHGNLFEFLRNDFFNANEWSRNFSLDPSVNSAPPKLRWNEFGGTFGGPIKKNKLFFFVDYQGSRYDTPATPGTINTFSSTERNGDLSDIPGISGSLHYPGTTVAMPANLSQATICAGGQTMGVDPCITGISPTALKIIAALPQATLPGLINNAPNTQHSYINGDQGDAKVDYVLSDKDRLSVRFSRQSVINPIVNSQALLYNSTGDNVFPVWNGVINYTRTLNSRMVNEFRAGVNYFPAEANTQTGGTAGAGLIPGQPTQFLPGLSFAGAPVGGVLNGPFAFGTVDSPEIFHQTSIQIEDNVSYSFGAHNMKFGFQSNRYRNDYVPSVTSDGAAGQLGFNGQYSGNAEADFLLGLPSYMGYGQGFSGTVGQRNNAFGAFAQDDWRITQHLTLNMGLRWQLFTPIYEVGNRMTNFGMYTGNIELAGVDGNSRALYNQYNGIANFLPRLGLAWTPGGKWGENTVIRAAFSRSSFQEGTGEYNRLATNAPWNTDLVSQPTPGLNGAIPSNQITLDQGFGALGAAGAACTPANVASAPASCFAGIRIHLQDPNYRPAVSNQWNFSIQRQFGQAMTFQAAYIGQHTDHLASIINAGQRVLLPDGTTIPGPYLGGNPTLKNDGTGQVRLNSTVGIQNYDALQLAFQRRLSKGLAFQINYTWSKCLTNNQGYYARYGDATASQASADVSFQEYAYNLGLDYGLCDHDVAQVFNGYLTYDLPFGKNRTFLNNANKVVNAILGDWQLNTVFTVHGGFPISMLDFAGDPGTGSFQPRPECNGPSIQTPYKNFAGGGYIWFDPSTMSAPPAGQFGSCGISTERGPGLKQVDIGLSKRFSITERQKIEFRAEAINAFNSPIFVVQGYVVDIFGGSQEGVVNTSQGARNLQFGLKYSF